MGWPSPIQSVDRPCDLKVKKRQRIGLGANLAAWIGLFGDFFFNGFLPCPKNHWTLRFDRFDSVFSRVLGWTSKPSVIWAPGWFLGHQERIIKVCFGSGIGRRFLGSPNDQFWDCMILIVRPFPIELFPMFSPEICWKKMSGEPCRWTIDTSAPQ